MSDVLRIEDLSAGYGPLGVLHSVDLTVRTGERVGELPPGAGILSPDAAPPPRYALAMYAGHDNEGAVGDVGRGEPSRAGGSGAASRPSRWPDKCVTD